jgi:hypothetical protein
MPIQLARAFRDVRGLVAHAFDVRRKFNRRNHPPQIRRYWLEAEQNFESVFVDLFFQLIDLFVIRDCVRAEIVIALQQSLERSIQTALSQAGHHQQIIAQRSQCFVECSKNVLRYNHCGPHFLLIQSRHAQRPRLKTIQTSL